MKAVIQRVDQASVRVDDQTISSIRKGLLVFLGIEKGDLPKDADYLVEKISHLRIFEDQEGKMNRSLLDIVGEMLVVSQFTLLADCRKGRRPSFTLAEDPDKAKDLYEYFIKKEKETLGRIAVGIFQAMMKIDIINDGPVTMLLDSRRDR